MDSIIQKKDNSLLKLLLSKKLKVIDFNFDDNHEKSEYIYNSLIRMNNLVL